MNSAWPVTELNGTAPGLVIVPFGPFVVDESGTVAGLVSKYWRAYEIKSD